MNATASTGVSATLPDANYQLFNPASTNNFDGMVGLKNWFGNIIHSFTLDYNGLIVGP